VDELIEAYAVVTKDGAYDLHWSKKAALDDVDELKGERFIVLKEVQKE
jgi:hypothetical protein